MLVKLSIKIINIYRSIPGPWHSFCKFTPTCSEYAKEVLKTHGFLKGWYLSIKRILRCNPFNKGGYDPPPKKI